MRFIYGLFILISGTTIKAQSSLIIAGQEYVNYDESWPGVNIARSAPTVFIFKNNSITSENRHGYMLQAGDEEPCSNNNNLKGEIISGNKFVWKGKDLTSITHSLFTGYNINAKIMYNYFENVPMAVIRKSNGMTDTTGVIAYNIFKNPLAVGVVVKGMNGTKIYNNTFYSEQTNYSNTGEGTWRGLIDIYTNSDTQPAGTATGTKIYNNIFYTVNQIITINIYEEDCLKDFESDNNLFYCENGSPLFKIGSKTYTFLQWQSLGFDRHSIILNPGFTDLVNFAPGSRPDYGRNLGADFATGLSPVVKWSKDNPETIRQDSNWQVGAIVLGAKENQPPEISIFLQVKNASPTTSSSITIDAIANDPDGSVMKVEFFEGDFKIGEICSPPFSFTWKEVLPGTYSITAIVTDDNNFKSISAPISVIVKNDITELINIYPNPNSGLFSLDLSSPIPDSKKRISILSIQGEIVYNEIWQEEKTSGQFDMSGSDSGTYILMVTQNNLIVSTRKFIKN